MRSFGTEDRPTERPVAERDEIYDFIVFRGSDIKDIKLCNVQKPYDDPAIVEVGDRCGTEVWLCSLNFHNS